MNSWKSDNDDWGIDDIFISRCPEDYTEDDFYTDRPFGGSDKEFCMDPDVEEHLINKQLEKECFENKPKHGKFASAYSHDIDNIKIIQLRENNCTLREIAKHFNCSPSTIRNRLRKMGMR